jgi:hypothetical protein
MSEVDDDLPENTDLVIEFASQNPEAFAQIGALITERESARKYRLQSQEYRLALQAQVRELLEPHDLKPGDFVEWKPGLKNRKRPNYGEAAVVVEVLEKPIVNTKFDSASSYFNEPLDLVIGLFDRDEELIIFHFDKRRFRPVSDETNQFVDRP